VVEYAAGIAPQLMGEFVEHVASGMDTYSIRQPLGVRILSADCCINLAAFGAASLTAVKVNSTLVELS
jgi:hypothetical protein